MALPIQAVGQKIAVATSAASATPTTNGASLLLTTNTDTYIKFGGTTASATVFDLFLPAGAAIVISQPVGGLISAIRATADGILGIQEVG